MKRKKFLNGLIVFGIASTLVLYSYIVSGSGFIKIYTLKNQTQNLEEQIEFELARQDSLKIKVEKLSHDLNTIEKVAREEYGMGRSDELVIKLRE